eukprot:gene17699-24057_t
MSLFGLPPEFLESVRIRSTDYASSSNATGIERQSSEPSGVDPSLAEKGGLAGPTCGVCGIGVHSPGFADAQQQREHFKSDWHRYNARTVMIKKKPAISEEEFEKIMGDEAEVSSLSGSDASGTDSDDEHSGGAREVSRNQKPQCILVADETPFAVWRCLLAKEHVKAEDPPSSSQLLDAFKKMARSTAQTWAVKSRQVLEGGQGQGLGTALANLPAQSFSDWFEVLDHKTFHRYVVRCGAGGKQSTKDASGKFARSAGSRLRRYNETALDNEIQELLNTTWKGQLAAANLIFVQATSPNSKSVFVAKGAPGGATSSNAKSVFVAKDAPGGGLQSLDPRVRHVPFPTQRPTFSETKRVAKVLATVMQLDAEALAREEEESKQAHAAAAIFGLNPGKASKAAAAEASARSKDNSKAMAPIQEDPSVDSEAVLSQTIEDSPLHKAAKAGDATIVSQLLENGSDPAVLDSRGRPPYMLAANKSEPELWDWSAAQIPSALSEEMEASQQAKKKAKQKVKEKERKAATAEKAKKSKEEEATAFDVDIAKAAAEAAALASRLNAANISGKQGNKTGGNSRAPPTAPKGKTGGKASAGPAASQAPLTPAEMAAKREKQAEAAEARMKALQQQAQTQKLW